MDALTTGEVAAICQVSPKTVANWIDGGRLVGHLVPGSNHRRVLRPVLEQFMKDHKIPLEWMSTE